MPMLRMNQSVLKVGAQKFWLVHSVYAHASYRYPGPFFSPTRVQAYMGQKEGRVQDLHYSVLHAMSRTLLRLVAKLPKTN